MRNIDLIRQVISASENNWPHVLGCLNINVPDSPRRHAPCPACGGKDRFRFDDNGRGSFICNQCGAGDGLDLIKRVNNCDTTEAALLAADVLGIDYRTTETPEATSQKREQLETERQRREQERLKRAEKDEQQRRDTFSRQFDDMRRKAVNGKSDYLVAKGVGDFTFPCCQMDLCCWRWWINPAQSQQHRLLPHMVKKTPDRFGKAGGISRHKRTETTSQHHNC